MRCFDNVARRAIMFALASRDMLETRAYFEFPRSPKLMSKSSPRRGLLLCIWPVWGQPKKGTTMFQDDVPKLSVTVHDLFWW